MVRTALIAAGVTLLLLAVAAAVVPIHVSYVISESMAPTLQPGDGYLIAGTDDVEAGDIITYRMSEGEQRVTHRVIDATPQGFITKGDANPTTDQAAGRPLVERSQIVGEVVTVGGQPVAIPGLGLLVGLIDRHGIVILGAVLCLLGVTTFRDSDRRPERPTRRLGTLTIPILAGAFVIAVALVIVGAQHATIAYTVTDDGRGDTLAAGESVERSHNVQIQKTRIVETFVRVDGMDVSDRTQLDTTGSALSSMVTMRLDVETTAPATPGRYETTISAYSYPPTLPRSTIGSLHSVHPVVAASVTVLVVFGPLALVTLTLVDRRTAVRLPRNRRLQRLLGRD